MYTLLYVTQFADAPVLTGLTVVLCGTLVFAGCFRAAVTFGLAFVSLAICVGVAKGLAAAAPALSAATGLQSPSGHVAGAIVLIGGATMCAGRGSWVLTVGLGAALIGYTRVALGFHTVADVVAGGVIGLAIVLGAIALGGARSWVEVPPEVGGPLIGALLAAAIFLNGWHPGIGRAASRAAHDFPSWRDRPFTLAPLSAGN